MNNTVMRRLAAAGFLGLLVFGCASAPKTAGPDLELQLQQLPDAGFAVEERGAVSIAYDLAVKNGLGEAVTLRKIEMHTIGESPYTLRDTAAEMNEIVPPGEEGHVTFTMWAYPREGRSSTKKAVWVSGVAWFDRSAGSFRKEFTLSFREP